MTTQSSPLHFAEPVTIDRQGFILRHHPTDNITEFIIKSDVYFDDRMAAESKKIMEENFPGKRFFLLVGSDGFFRVTKKARRLGASRAFSNHLCAVACYTTNASLLLIAELYIKINKPAVPTKLFSSREAAEEWLHEKITAENVIAQ
jgi:hypothetical protein